jgi:hypothetical protein
MRNRWAIADRVRNLSRLEDGTTSKLNQIEQLEVEVAIGVNSNAGNVGELAAQNLPNVTKNKFGSANFENCECEDS